MFIPRHAGRTLALLGCCLSASFLFSAETSSSSGAALHLLTYSGDQSALDALDRDLVAAGTDATKLAALEKRMLDVLRRTDATFAARQAVAQRLGAVLAASAPKTSADALKAFSTLILDERDSDVARLALEPAPGEAVDAVFVSALDKTSGRTRLGVIDSIARRRSVSAVAELAKLLKDSDAATAASAARALGEIADPTAVAALHTTPEPSPHAIAAAKLAAAPRLPPAAALGLLNELQSAARDPVHRAAAFRLSLDVELGAAAARIADVLGGSDLALKPVALEALAASRAPNLVSTLSAKLSAWDAPTQSAVIAALARRRDPAATPAIVTATKHTDPEVRAAAIEALGFLPGTQNTAALLAGFAAGTDTDDARLARQSLARLNGPDVSAAILAGAERGEPGVRAAYIEQLALRNMTEGMPLLLKSRADPSPAVRIAAIGALGDIAPPSEQKAVLDWAIEANDPAEQSRALRSLVNVTLRNPNAEERGRAVFALVDTAQPELASRLLPALPRIGGAAAAETVARLAVRDDPKIAEPAASVLSRWPDTSALPALATVAEKAAQPASRTAALEGAQRFFERREPWKPESTTIVARLIASTTDTDARKKLIRLLHRASDAKALALIDSLKSDATLAEDLAIAADVVRANLAGAPKLRASSSSGLSNILDGKTSTRWSTSALGEEWIEVDFNLSRPLSRVTLDQTGRSGEFPEHFEVFVTDNPQQPGASLVSGRGQNRQTIINLPAGTRGRFLIVKNTAERKDAPWAVCELIVE